MTENTLKHIDGKKIRRQYFNVPLIILYTLMLAIPYFIFVISLCGGKFDSYEWPSTFFISVWTCFVFSLPWLVLRTLNQYCFGKIICVLNEEGIHYSNKAKLCWETVEKIEYVMDSNPRYRSDTGKAYRTIVYTKGGRHIVLANTPLYMVSAIKKYQKELDVKILGAKEVWHTVLIMAAILLLVPFYVVLLVRAPGALSVSRFAVSAIIGFVLGIILIPVFDAYNVEYRFWSKVLPKKWLAYILLGGYYSSYFVGLLILFYFPNWVVVSLFGIYLGVVQPPVPSRHGNRRHLLSYRELYELYITKADLWKERIEKRKNRSKDK